MPTNANHSELVFKEKIQNHRFAINQIDKKIVALLRERFCIVKDIGQLKEKHGEKAKKIKREQDVIQNVRQYADFQGLHSDIAETVYITILQQSVKVQNGKQE